MMNDNQEIKIGTTDDDRNELKPSCRVEFDTTPQQVESLAVEWKSGDTCVIRNPHGFGMWEEAEKYLGSTGTVMSVFTNTNGFKVAAVSHNDCVCICWMLSMLERPETPRQREERIEAAYDLYAHWAGNSEIMKDSFEQFIASSQSRINAWCSVVDKTRYRKDSK